MPPARNVPDGGGGDPVSKYDYHKLSLPELEQVLNVGAGAIKAVQADWQNLASNLTSLISDPGLSLEAAMALLACWDSHASGPFKDRVKAVHDFGQQIAAAAFQEAESFANPGQTFHMSTRSLGASIDQMNQFYGFAQQARQTWMQELKVLVQSISSYYGPGAPAGQAPFAIGGMTGGFETYPEANGWNVNFDYWYGAGLVGLVHFSGQVQTMNNRATVTEHPGPYQAVSLTVPIMAGAAQLSPDSFPNTYQDQLAQLLNQVGGSLYAPLVNQFPKVPEPSWTGNSPSQQPHPNGTSGYSGGSAGAPSLTSGAPAFHPAGGTSGLVPGGPGSSSHLPGTSQAGFGHPGVQSGLPAASGLPSGQSGVAPTHLASFNPSSAGSGSGLATPGAYSGLATPAGFAGGRAGLGGVGGGLGGVGGGVGGVGGGLGGALGSTAGESAGAGAAGTAADSALGATAAAGGRGMPMMPPMMPPMGMGNSDKDRQRKSWLPEDEDIWGGDGTAVPPVISGDS
jgi:hypothetical protein